MKNFAKIIAVLLMAAMALTLCACTAGDEIADETTENETTVIEETTEADTTEAAEEATFTVSVVDEAGNAISGVMVQVCDDSNCFVAASNEEGKALFMANQITEITSGHSLTLVKVPEGYTYEYSNGNKLYLESGITEFTVTLVAEG